MITVFAPATRKYLAYAAMFAGGAYTVVGIYDYFSRGELMHTFNLSSIPSVLPNKPTIILQKDTKTVGNLEAITPDIKYKTLALHDKITQDDAIKNFDDLIITPNKTHMQIQGVTGLLVECGLLEQSKCLCGNKNIQHTGCGVSVDRLCDHLKNRINFGDITFGDIDHIEVGDINSVVQEDITPKNPANTLSTLNEVSQPSDNNMSQIMPPAPNEPSHGLINKQCAVLPPKGVGTVTYLPGLIARSFGIKPSTYDFSKFIDNTKINDLEARKIAEQLDVITSDLIDKATHSFCLINKWPSGYVDRKKCLDHMHKLASIHLTNVKKDPSTMTDLELNKHMITIQKVTDEVSSKFLYALEPHQKQSYNIIQRFVSKWFQ
jgi:hypothetical protein